MNPSQSIPFQLKAAAALLVSMAVAATAAHAQSGQPLPDAPRPMLHDSMLHDSMLRGPGNIVPASIVPASIVIERATPGPMPLTLDEAIDRALTHNVQLKIDEQSVRLVQGQIGTAINALLPSLTAVAHTGTQETDLAALGFKPAELSKFGLNPALFPLIVKYSTTGAQLNISQTFFNVPAYQVYRAAQSEVSAADLNMRLTRGNVVMYAGTQYLRALADQAQIENAATLLKQDQEQLRQATDRDQAGVGIRLDVLRAQVQVQTQQQTLIAAQDAFAKDKITLDRTLGLPAEQDIQFTDAVPYNDLTLLSLDDAKALAYEHRKDYTSLLASLEVARRERLAVRYERLPTLGFNGFYGVLGETTGLYHGVFTAEGSVNFPVFREATFRGEREAADAALTRLQNQVASLRQDIDQQIRSSQLDVQAAAQLVKVASSSADLSRQELSDADDRYAAGVDDNLRVIEAQANLAQAHATLIEDEFQLNLAKLTLARNTGVVETQYKSYLGR